MIKMQIPGSGELIIEHLVLDYNGTIAMDGELIEGVSEVIELMARDLEVHVLTADTNGTVMERTNHLPVTLETICSNTKYQGLSEEDAKLKYLEAIGTDRTVAIGNGANDVKMLKAAAIGIAVIGPEGCSTPAILSSDVVTGSITDALDILAHSHRIKATMRR